ncbi:sigma-54-dependent Fis family transcriptional regulator [Saccharopolyspora tripterygii]
MNGINETGRPVPLPFDEDAVRRAKEALLTNGLLTSPVSQPGVRDIIERSWRRCIGEGVPAQPRFNGSWDAAERQSILVDAARPVLERLSEHLADARVALFLSDDKGHIVMRKAAEHRQRNQLDNASAAEGFDFSERSIGTNGLGTVIAERRPLLVRGSEHYNDALETLTCAGTPIFEPFSQRILGTFALACRADDTSPLISAIATDVGRQIESNLTTLLGAEERALIQSYLLANKSEKHPVIVFNERTVFANTLGLRHVSSETHALLWTHLRDSAVRREPQQIRVPLPSGWHDAVVEHVDGTEGERSAYCVRLLPVQPHDTAAPQRTASRNSRAGVGSPPESVHPRPDIEEQLSTAIRHRECLALDGEPGAGKLHVATAIFATHFPGTPPLVLDLSTCRRDNGHSWFTSAMEALTTGRGVVLRHLQDSAPSELNRIKAIAERSQEEHGTSSAPLILTIDTQNAPEPTRTLVDQLATTVRLPALAEMPEQLPSLVARMLAAIPDAERRPTFSSEALQLLMSWSWPGNIAELRKTVEFLAHRMPGTTVAAGDLPTRMQQTAPHRQLTMMEAAERESISTALRQSGGNRSQAASALGIGRTTLYRKMRFYRLD